MSKTKNTAARSIASAHIQMYRATGGLLGGLVGGMPVLLLTTTGRRSGKARTTPLTYLRIDGRVLVVASYGGDQHHPAWYLNLDGDPHVEVQRWRKTTPATARTIAGADRDAMWSKIVRRAPIYAWYQRQTDREIPVVELVIGDEEELHEPDTEVDLESMTRAELARIASDLQLPGRSKMNKAALVAALRERESEISDAARGI